MDFNAASEYIIHRLRLELNPGLSYHCAEHTFDVLEAVNRISVLERIEHHDHLVLQTAALYHDAGMIVQYKDHESASVLLARQTLPRFGYSPAEIDQIAGLIMVTKLPQRPYTLHEQIICDADLDYLGRDDFYINSFKLRLEWQVNGVLNTTLAEWINIQFNFLNNHRYFTNSAILLRNEKKLQHLDEIKRLIPAA